uniref:Uncharacterized protein n=1 Tax=Corethron hystrix TaxID=216773 RepID=A0A6U5KSW8_9STRA
MLSSLLVMAQDLEGYVTEAEASCNALIRTLTPTYKTYQMEITSPPKMTEISDPSDKDMLLSEDSTMTGIGPPWGKEVLSALDKISSTCSTPRSTIPKYQNIVSDENTEMQSVSSQLENSCELPLANFTPREVLFPPWGDRVATALNKISAASITNGIDSVPPNSIEPPLCSPSFDPSSHAVKQVVDAFESQLNEEMARRMDRKNFQVINRLGRIQAHNHRVLSELTDAYRHSALANAAAERFHQRCLLSRDPLGPGQVLYGPADRVPLMRCSIGKYGLAGRCELTRNELLLSIRPKQFFGKKNYYVRRLADVTFRKSDHNMVIVEDAFPANEGVKTQKLVFRPSMNANQLLLLVRYLQEVLIECSSNGLILDPQSRIPKR